MKVSPEECNFCGKTEEIVGIINTEPFMINNILYLQVV